MNVNDDTAARAGWPWPDELDAMQAASEHHKVLLENDQVRVLESWVAPGDTVPVHTHRWPGVLHVLGTSHFVRRNAEGEVMIDSRESGPPLAAGSTVWLPALVPHSLENVGEGELRVITVEIKD